MARNFNIRDYDQDPSYSFHLVHSDSLFDIANSFDLELLVSTLQVPNHYADDPNDTNSVISLIFLSPNLNEIDNHQILPEFRYSSNHTSLIVNISIKKKFVQEKYRTIIKNSEEEANFILELTKAISNTDISHIVSKDSLEAIVYEYMRLSVSIWFKHSCNFNITKCSNIRTMKDELYFILLLLFYFYFFHVSFIQGYGQCDIIPTTVTKQSQDVSLKSDIT